MICMIIFGVLLDLIVWRHRHLAFLMLYYELVMVTTMSFMPYDIGKDIQYHTQFIMGFTFIIMMVECRFQPIITSIMTGVILLITHPCVYHIDSGPK